MEGQVAGLAFIFGANIEDKDSRHGRRESSEVAVANDLGRIGLVDRNDQMRSFEKIL